ncbi:MAG: class I SAM-dependent methyltransferase [Euryarchaeota archaeon]|nr:class I SAM-dependent methyltransferase [Euryarchaeota archaeon]
MTPSDARSMDPADWKALEECLTTIIPTYERVNRAMSLGQVGRWRRAVQRHVAPGETVVELGSGPGQFAAGLPYARVLLVDPLVPMQQAARARLDGQDAAFVVATGEHVPFRSGIADHVVCAFSFRDFLDKRAGLAEMHRLLRPGGRFWVLDVHKAERGPLKPLVHFHVHRVVPPLARLITPRAVRRRWTDDPYAAFARTYDAFGTPGTYREMAESVGFTEVSHRLLSLGGAMLLSGRKG